MRQRMNATNHIEKSEECMYLYLLDVTHDIYSAGYSECSTILCLR